MRFSWFWIVIWPLVVLHFGYYIGAINGFYGWHP